MKNSANHQYHANNTIGEKNIGMNRGKKYLKDKKKRRIT